MTQSLTPTDPDTIARDVVNGVRGLQTAVDALGMIAMLGGVQGDWALDALREIDHTMRTPAPLLRLVESEAGR